MRKTKNEHVYGFVYKPRNACDKCESQGTQNMTELVWQLGRKRFYKTSRGARHSVSFRGTAIQGCSSFP